jgi:tRNA/tmRNA/rRNA uracil-C5-methylase (TrmA/RlmC/RlmD family)
MDSIVLTISDVAYRGKGVARMEDGFVVFVPGTLTGEQVEAVVRVRHRHFGEAELVQVLAPSPARMTPVCPLAPVCPGCRYQHVRYEEELRLKQAQFIDLLGRLGGLRAAPVLAPIASPLELGYRNKIVLHGSRRDSGAALGYFSEDNTSVIDVPACPLAVTPINELLSQLRSDTEFMAGLREHLRLTLRWTPTDGVKHWPERTPPGGADRNPDAWLRETTALGPLRVPRGSFFQVNAGAADRLLAEVSRLVKEAAPALVADLYCGVGVFALAAAAQGVGDIFGVDTDEPAILAARVNARELGLERARFEAIPAERGLERLPAGAGAKGMIIVDPPRAGLVKAVLRRIQAARFRHLVYVSCAPDTLARDLRLLAAMGYAVQSVRLVDMFPRTPYFESVTHLLRET